MMNSKWELVLIEWVNCLNMSSPIEKLESLQNGPFLINFMNALIKTQLSLSNMIPHIKSFIKTEYSSFNFNLLLSTDNISDLSVQELTPVLSILMHYSCIINQRDIFTSPMCYHISRESQIYIKRFLEQMNCAIGDINVIELINKCVSIEENSSLNQWISSAGDSPLNLRTPLKEYLQTPFKTLILSEKEHEIKKLRTCLELESFEKTDLMEELKEHKENIHHLKQQLKGKGQEVSKLKKELFEVEKKHSPRSVKKKYDLNHQLRKEMVDLEKYIAQLQNEQEELQVQKDGSNRKLKKAELQLTAANEKICSLEVVCDQLSDERRNEQHELETLRANCSELNQLLAELRRSQHNNTSFLDLSQENVACSSGKRMSRNLNDTDMCEDLACSVIEVQLRDAQEENVNLKSELNKTIDMNNSISLEMEKLKRNYVDLQQNLETTEEDKTKLHVQLENLKTSFESLQINRQELIESLNGAIDEKWMLSNEGEYLAKLNAEISIKLQQNVCEVLALERKLDETRSAEIAFKNVNDAQMKQIDKLKEESFHLEQVLKQKVSYLSEANCKISVLENKFDALDSKFDSNLKKLEQMLRGGNFPNTYSDKNDVFECLLIEFEAKECKDFDDKEDLRLKLHDFELDVDTLEKNIDDLKLKELSDFEFCLKLQESLKQTELKHDLLTKSITEKDNVIGKLKRELNEMEVVAEELNVLKHKFIQKENDVQLRETLTENSVLNFTRDLQSVNKILESRTFITVREIIEESVDLEENKDLKRFKEIWTLNDKNFLKEVTKINNNIAAIISDLQEKSLELKTCVEEGKLKDFELEQIQQKFKHVKNEFDLSKIDFNVKIQLVEEARIKSEEEVYKQSHINKLQVREIEQLSEKFKNLTNEKDGYVTKSEALKDDIKTLMERVIASEHLCEERDDILAKSSQELLTWKLEMESKKQENAEMKEEMCKLYSEIGVVKSEMLQQRKECEGQEMQMDVLKKEVQFLESLKEDLSKKIQDLEANNLHVIQQLTLKNRECSEFIEVIKKSKHKKELDILNLKENLEKSNSEILELNQKFDTTSAKYNIEMKMLNLEKGKLIEQILNLESMGKDYITDIKLIKLNVAKVIKECFNFAKKNQTCDDDDFVVFQNEHNILSMKDLEQVFQQLYSVFKCLYNRKMELERNVDKYSLELNGLREKEGLHQDNIIKIGVLTARENVLQENLKSSESALLKVEENIRDFKVEFAEKQKQNEINLDSKVFEISGLRTEIEELKEILSKMQIENKALLDANESEISKRQDDLTALEKVFSDSKVDSEKMLKCNENLEKKLLDVQEQCEREIKSKEEEILVLNETYDKLKINCLVFEQVVATEKAKLEEIFNDKDVTIGDLSSKLNSTQTKFESANNQLKDLENQLTQKVSELSKISTEKSFLSIELLKVENSLEKSKCERDVLLESHRKVLEDTEINMKNAHENAVQLKNNLQQQLMEAQTDVLDTNTIKRQVEEALIGERLIKEALELRIFSLQDEKVNLEQVKYKYYALITNLNGLLTENRELNVPDDFVALQDVSNQIERQIIDVIESRNDLAETIKVLKVDQESMLKKVNTLEELQNELSEEKGQLLQQFEQLQLETSIQNQKHYDSLSTNYELLKAKYEQYKHYARNNEKKHLEIAAKFQKLSGTNEFISENYAVLRQKYQTYKMQVEVLIKNRNLVEVTLSSLSEKWSALQSKSTFINEESPHKSHFEKKLAIDIVINDLQKQFARCSKIAYKICFNLCNIFDIATQKTIAAEYVDQHFDDAALNETKQKLEEITELAADATIRVDNYTVPSESNSTTNILKESNSNLQSGLNNDLDELRKKFNTMKQKLILVENTKTNYERKIHLLREEIHKVKQNERPLENLDSEAHYNTLLQQHLQTKEEHETLIMECETKYKQLLREFDNYKKEHPRASELSANAQIVNKSLQDRAVKLEKEVHKLRDAYGNLMSDKSKLELENITIKKILDDRNARIADLIIVKQAYEKLLEDNNKLQTDIDTLHYKKTKDREEFVRILKNEQDEYENREGKRIQDIRNEYELKLEKMKNKIVQLYKEEVDKEMQKVFSEKSSNTTLMETIEHLRDELTSTQQKLELLESERTIALNQLHQHCSQQRQSTTTTITHHHNQPQQLRYRHAATSGENLFDALSNHLLINKDCMLRSDSRLNSRGRGEEMGLPVENRSVTLPRTGGYMDVLEEIRIQKRTSISANGGVVPATNSGSPLVMEDEDDMFNNKYLADLKEGRCQPKSLTNKNTRLSELVYRNSMCLPHLKSSYPCETQFTSPSTYNEENIKLGSNKTPPPITRHSHLPPPHPHQRLRKDAGTTSYKRPGPPTPSKNGGRASLSSVDRIQGAVLPLREVNDGRVSIATSVVQQARNKLTPTRLKALFTVKGKGNTTAAGGSTLAAEQHQAAHIICECTCHTTVIMKTTCNKFNISLPKSKPAQSNDKRSLWTRQSISLFHLMQRVLRLKARTTPRSGTVVTKCQRKQNQNIRRTTWMRIAQHMLFLTCVLCASACAVRYFHGGGFAKHCCTY